MSKRISKETVKQVLKYGSAWVVGILAFRLLVALFGHTVALVIFWGLLLTMLAFVFGHTVGYDRGRRFGRTSAFNESNARLQEVVDSLNEEVLRPRGLNATIE